MSDASLKESKPKNWFGVTKVSDKQVSKFGGPLRVVGTILAVFIIGQLIGAITVGLILNFMHPGSDSGTLLANSAAAQFFFIFIAEILAVGLIYLTLRRKKMTFGNIGLNRGPKWRDLKLGVLGFLSFYGLLIITTIIVSWLIPSLDVDQAQNVGFENLQSSLDRLLAFVSLVLLVPVGEEILMRGYLYTGLRASWKFLPALLMTSLIFGLAHLEFDGGPLVWVAALDTFILSVVLIYVRERSAALYASIFIHMLNNTVAYLVHFS